MKKTLTGKRFSDVDEVKENTLTALKSIPSRVPELFPAVEKTLGQVHLTLKGTKIFKCKFQYNCLQKIIPVIFGSALVYIHIYAAEC
jgi:hypothetical protein